MKHALTKVTLKVKSGDKYVKEITSLSINAATGGELHFKNGGFEWTNVTNTYSYTPSATTDLTFAATDQGRDVATFLLLPTATVTATFSLSYKVKDITGNEKITRTFTAQALPSNPQWTPGAHITYTINLSEKTATVTTKITAWEKDTSHSFDVKTFYPNDLKIGDYFYDDGSWSDGGLRVHITGTNQRTWAAPFPAPVTTNPQTGKERKLIGIVFSTTVGDKDKEKGWTHGYVMGSYIYRGQGGAGAFTTLTGGDRPSQGVALNISNQNLGSYNGYDLCQRLMTDSHWNAGTASSVFPAVYNTCVLHNQTVPTPTGTSTWYLPNADQLHLLWKNLGGTDWRVSNAALTNLTAQVRKTGSSFSFDGVTAYYTCNDFSNQWGYRVRAAQYGGKNEDFTWRVPTKGANLTHGAHIPVLAF